MLEHNISIAYEVFNTQLLRLILSGKGESKQADVIRAAMDEYWAKMTPEEQAEAKRRNETQL